MHKNVEQLIGQLATDPALLRRFAANPLRFLLELVERGFELSDVELDALGSIPPEALRTFAAALDARLRKAPLTEPLSDMENRS
jgi:hypothetical protein